MVSIRFLPEQVDALREKANLLGLNVSQLIRRVVASELDMRDRRDRRAGLCEWQASCKNVATGFVHLNREDHPLCDDHLDPEKHPPDLRTHLHRGKPLTPCLHVRQGVA